MERHHGYNLDTCQDRSSILLLLFPMRIQGHDPYPQGEKPYEMSRALVSTVEGSPKNPCTRSNEQFVESKELYLAINPRFQKHAYELYTYTLKL